MHAAKVVREAYPSPVVGYHGCRRQLGMHVLQGEVFPRPSGNPYDWLGHGLYFWEDNYERARAWAEQHCEEGDAFVLGAHINLGRCLNLLEKSSLRLVRSAYEILEEATIGVGKQMPKNSVASAEDTFLRRELDCTVINTLHQNIEISKREPFDTVRGAFWEGAELYPDAGFRSENHIQVCVRNPRSILGFFLPLEENKYPLWDL